MLDLHRLFDSDSGSEASGGSGTLTGFGIDSSRLCKEGARKALRLAAATAAAEKPDRVSFPGPSSSSLSTVTPGTVDDVKEISSSRIMCSILRTIFPTANSVFRPTFS